MPEVDTFLGLRELGFLFLLSWTGCSSDQLFQPVFVPFLPTCMYRPDLTLISVPVHVAGTTDLKGCLTDREPPRLSRANRDKRRVKPAANDAGSAVGPGRRSAVRRGPPSEDHCTVTSRRDVHGGSHTAEISVRSAPAGQRQGKHAADMPHSLIVDPPGMI